MIALIVAMDENRLIGKDNQLPWHYPEDLKYFKEKTMNETVIMGRKTYEAIVNHLGRPLPKRDNIVLTRQERSFPGARVIHDLKAYLETIPRDKTVFIIGGSSVYAAALPFADRLYITHIGGTYSGDTYFPDYDETKFAKIASETCGNLSFAVYQRKDTTYDYNLL